MRLLALLLIAVLCSPLAALTLKLKADEREFRADDVSLTGEQVTYRRGSRTVTAKLDDFELGSVWRIRAHVASTAAEHLDVARFALHRSLYAEAIESARNATRLDPNLDTRAERVIQTARVLHADALVHRGADLLDAQNPEEARKLFEQVVADYADTPATAKAEILLGTVTRVELEIRARELEELARKAQEEADDDERRRRKPVDDWLAEFQRQIEAAAATRREGDDEARENRLNAAVGKYNDAANILLNVRKSLSEGQRHLTFRGQTELAAQIDADAHIGLVNTYERWAYELFHGQLYKSALEICNRGLKLAPGDRRLLLLKVDLDEALHGMNR